MKGLEKLKSEIELRKARAGGANVLTLVNVNTVLVMIDAIWNAETIVRGIEERDEFEKRWLDRISEEFG